jgi:hypothetical protein
MLKFQHEQRNPSCAAKARAQRRPAARFAPRYSPGMHPMQQHVSCEAGKLRRQTVFWLLYGLSRAELSRLDFSSVLISAKISAALGEYYANS